MYIMYIHEVHSEQSLNLIVTSVAIYITLHSSLSTESLIEYINMLERSRVQPPIEHCLGKLLTTLYLCHQAVQFCNKNWKVTAGYVRGAVVHGCKFTAG